jgi:hypothetical protein
MRWPVTDQPGRAQESIEGVCEVFRFGEDGPADLLIELPHGATERVHYDAVAARLASPLPARLEQFFHVNTDFGVPELAREVAARLTGPARKASVKGVVVVRALVPRTFIDFNRVIGEGAQTGMTPGLQPYVTAPADRDLLLSLYQQYHVTVARLYRETCGAGGVALTLHSYSPRSVEVEVDADIVTALRAAYRPAVYGSWALRPAVDFITRDGEGQDLSPPGLAAQLQAAYTALGLDAGENTAYHLHAASMGFRYSAAHPGQVLCAEFRRDLLGAPWRPFAPSRVGPRKIGRLAGPLAEALAGGVSRTAATR